MTFAIRACNLRPRCALEAYNGGVTRIDRIITLIRDCRWGIHDLSRTDLDPVHGLPRFNMPLELGLFLGANRFGDARQREKSCLVLDREKFRYQKFISDIAGQDIIAHDGSAERAIHAVRDWLASELPTQEPRLMGGPLMAERFGSFRADLPKLCHAVDLNADRLTFNDYCEMVVAWLEAAPR